MLSIQDVMETLRDETRPIYRAQLADAIEAAMREKDVEIDRLKADREQGARDYCALMDRHDDQHNENERLRAKLTECDGKLGKRPCQNNRCMEFVRLREALERIKANRYGLQSLIEEGANEKAMAEYWANTAMEYQQIARAALAGKEWKR